MKHQIFWVIKGPDGNYYPNSCKRTREESISNFEKFCMQKWQEMERKGYECIGVKLMPLDFEEKLSLINEVEYSYEN